MILIPTVGYQPAPIDEATHLKLRFPGPSGVIVLPIQIGGTRKGSNNWSWNGSIDQPTLKPSVKTTGGDYVCHSFVNNGQVQFLSDCTHEFANSFMDLLEADDD